MSDQNGRPRGDDSHARQGKRKMSKKRQRAMLKRRLMVMNMLLLLVALVVVGALAFSLFGKGVTVSAKAGETKVALKWNEKFMAQKYDVMRSQDDDSKFVKLATVGETKYVDEDIEPGHAYYYKVVSENIVGKTGSKEQICYLKPGKVESLKLSSKNDEIKASWDEAAGAQTYHVERRAEDAKDFKEIDTTDEVSYTDKDVEEGKKYTYRIFASYTANAKEITGDAGEEKEVKCTNIDPNGKMIALTFDDGPGQYTKELVEALKKYKAHATFFVLGQNAEIFKEEVKMEQEAGCEVASHTYDHANLDTLGASAIKEEVDKTDKIIADLIGNPPPLIRTPYGATSETTKATVNKPIIFWSIDTLDWKTRDTNSTIQAVMDNAQDGDIALMHDIHEPTKDAAIALIPKLIDKGFQLVTVSELAEYKGVKLEKGTVYSEIGKTYN